MDVIETRIDTNSEEYKKNYEAMDALVADLKAELKKAREDRPARRISTVWLPRARCRCAKSSTCSWTGTPRFWRSRPWPPGACTTAGSTLPGL
ncbi:MAG: hypothetical protein MZV70_10770 [Desulfobacterales bacterium]|nr:hypothetical protein [Desulfobacterales bacterium]